MSFIHSKTSRAILGDFPLSAYLQKVLPDLGIEMNDTTVLTSTGRECIPGLENGKVSIAGLLDSDGAATGQHRQIFDQLGATAEDVFSLAEEGFARGNRVMTCLVREAKYGPNTDPASAVAWSADLASDGRVDLMGVSLVDVAAITVDTNGTGVDNAASTANGGCGVLHVAAYSGLTNVVFKVQHSTDNSSWADLVTFTTVTAIGSQRVEVAAGTTVNRYLRFFADVTGSGSVTPQMSFARR